MKFTEEESKPVYSTTILLAIDADSLIYKAAHIGEKVWNEAAIPANHPLFEELKPDLHVEQKVVLKGMIDGIIEDVRYAVNQKGKDIGEVQLHYTPKSHVQKERGLKPNFRYKLIDEYNEEHGGDHPGYKSGRKGMTLPEGLNELFDYAMGDERAVLSDGQEADDVVVYEKMKNLEGVVISCIDKDIYNSCPSGDIGHFNFNKREWIHTTHEEGQLFQHRQALTGDSSDTIKGIHRYGPRTAEKDLEGFTEDLWARTLAVFEAKGYSEEYGILMMRLVGMFQGRGNTVELWNPPTVIPEECIGCKYLQDGKPTKTCLHCEDYNLYEEIVTSKTM